jgi:hypothetical protein
MASYDVARNIIHAFMNLEIGFCTQTVWVSTRNFGGCDLKLWEKVLGVSGSFVVVKSLQTRLVVSGAGGVVVDVTRGGPMRRHAFFCPRSLRLFVSPPPSVGLGRYYLSPHATLCTLVYCITWRPMSR